MSARASLDCCAWGSANLVDGIRAITPSSRGYTSDPQHTDPNHVEWVQVDLGQVRDLGRVWLWPRTATVGEPTGNGGAGYLAGIIADGRSTSSRSGIPRGKVTRLMEPGHVVHAPSAGEDGSMSDIFPSPTLPVSSRAGVFLGYLDYFRARVIAKVEGLDATEQRRSRLPSGWAPLEVVKHLMFVELRWLEWGFEGRSVDDPWGDQRDEHWHVSPDESAADLIVALMAQGVRSKAIIEGNDLTAVGQPGPRWEGAEPATLERILFHLVQEYVRHHRHLDIVVEIANGPVGE